MNTEIKKYVNAKIGNKFNPVILEIGAHYGEDTIDMKGVFNYPTIHCFEPDPRNVKIIEKYLLMTTDRGSKIYLNNVAASNSNGEADFYLSYRPLNGEIPEKYRWIDSEDYIGLKINDSGSSSLKYGPNNEHVRSAEKIKVKTVRLDDWIVTTNIDHIDFIWMDVQGAEGDVIDGGVNVFKMSDFVWTEYGEMTYEGALSKRATMRKFEDMGFLVDVMDRENLLFRRAK